MGRRCARRPPGGGCPPPPRGRRESRIPGRRAAGTHESHTQANREAQTHPKARSGFGAGLECVRPTGADRASRSAVSKGRHRAVWLLRPGCQISILGARHLHGRNSTSGYLLNTRAPWHLPPTRGVRRVRCCRTHDRRHPSRLSRGQPPDCRIRQHGDRGTRCTRQTGRAAPLPMSGGSGNSHPERSLSRTVRIGPSDLDRKT